MLIPCRSFIIYNIDVFNWEVMFVYSSVCMFSFQISHRISILFGIGSSVSIVSDYGLGDRGSIPDRGRGFFF
jgi:hypothetical protein